MDRPKRSSAERMGFTRAENDLCSWMLLNGDDLFPPVDPDLAPVGSFQRNPPVLTFPGDEDPLNAPPLDDFGLHISDAMSSKSNSTSDNYENPKEKNFKTNKVEKKREERLQRNREIARNCRKRKREKIEAMQIELEKLKDEKAQLEMQVTQLQKVQNGSSSKAEDQMKVGRFPYVDVRRAEYREINKILQQHDMILAEIEDIESRKDTKEDPVVNFEGKTKEEHLASLKTKLDEHIDELQTRLNLCKELHSDFGNARANEINFHLQQLQKLLIPNQLSKITLWSLQQEDDFFDESTDTKKFGGGLWNTLSSEFRLTKEQKLGLMALRKPIRSQRGNIGECLKIVQELEGRVKSNFDSLKSQMTEIIRITTPVQQARFLMWIERNQACMYMLNDLWEQEKLQKLNDVKTEENQEIKMEAADADYADVEETDNKEKSKVSTAAMEQALKTGRTLAAMRALIEKQSSTDSSVSTTSSSQA